LWRDNLSRGATEYPQPRVERSGTLGNGAFLIPRSPGGTEYIALSGLGNPKSEHVLGFRFASPQAAGTSPLRGWLVAQMLATKKQLASSQRDSEKEELSEL
jgi:hypothetical protein